MLPIDKYRLEINRSFDETIARFRFYANLNLTMCILLGMLGLPFFVRTYLSVPQTSIHPEIVMFNCLDSILPLLTISFVAGWFYKQFRIIEADILQMRRNQLRANLDVEFLVPMA